MSEQDILFRLKTALKNIHTTIERLLRVHPYLSLTIALALIGLLAISRRPDMFLHAQFWAEDGTIWYADAYHQGFWGTILKPYPEFLEVPERLFSFIATLLPFRFAPLFFNMVGLCFMLLPIVPLLGGRFKQVVPSRLTALLLTVIYVALPNTAEIFSSFANIQWHLCLAALLILLAKPDKQLFWRIFDWTILVACGLSGPLAIFLVPVATIKWWLTKDSAYRRNAYIICGLALVQIFTAVFISTFHRTGTPPAADFVTFAQIVSGQIFVGGIFGQDYIDMFYKDEVRLYLVLIAGLSFMVYAFIKGPLWLKILNIFSPILVAATLFTLKNPPDAGYDVWQGLTNPTGGQRYWYIPIAIWLITLGWLAVHAKNKILQSIAITMIILLLVIGVPQGWHIKPMINYEFKAYVQQFETLQSGQQITIPINPNGWHMSLTKK